MSSETDARGKALTEKQIIKANSKLRVHGDDTKVVCEEHNVSTRWKDLDSMTQLAVLSGFDVEGPNCIMQRRTPEALFNSQKDTEE